MNENEIKQDEIIGMAREAGISSVWAEASTRQLERFAALVAAHEREKCFDAAMKAAEKAVDTAMLLEREACAKVCDDIGDSDNGYGCAAAIRARGEK